LTAALVLLQAHTALASTLYVDDINVDENGHGTYDVQDLGAGTTSALQPLTMLTGGDNAGVTYQLPYPIHINSNYNQYWAISDPDGSQSDLVYFANTAGSANPGTMTVYSNDNDGDLADVSPAVWSTLVSSYTSASALSAEDAATGIAFRSTYGDNAGVPGDPQPHPTIEANYYVNSVPEPASLALLGTFGVGVAGWTWRRRRA
jgi:hypothetical protein